MYEVRIPTVSRWTDSDWLHFTQLVSRHRTKEAAFKAIERINNRIQKQEPGSYFDLIVVHVEKGRKPLLVTEDTELA